MNSCIFNFIFDEVPPHIKEYCVQYPWFADLLNDASLRPIRTPGRQPDHTSTGDCELLGRTLNTGNTIPALQSFYQTPPPAGSAHTQSNIASNLGELLTFYTLGSGLDGYGGICHGGFLSTAIDHAMGTLARNYPGGNDTYTKYLHVDFKKPFYTPGAILCRAWITKIEGRKLWVCGAMEDNLGNPYITAESLFLKAGISLGAVAKPRLA
ncbi:hypothetical protein MMC28_006053 [Mycoblastus sanguinarius]|nr:hypothetical protein [Mycoblastus sanguinarius]